MRLNALIALLVVSFSFVGLSSAQTFPDPSKTITVIVPFSAGGGTDLVIRSLVNEMTKFSDANIIISNIPGAGSATGTNELLAHPANGYTLLTSGTHTITATLEGLTDGFKSLEGIAGLNWDPFVVAVLASRPYKTFPELLHAAQQKPGTLCLGNAGIGGATGAASIGLNLAFNKVFNVVSFNGGADLIPNVLGGRCEAGIFSQSEIIANLNKLRPIVILYKERSSLPELAQVPTLVEAGFPDLDVPGGSFRSLSVKSGTPEDVKETLAKIVKQAYESENYQAFMKKQGLIPAFSELGQFDAYMSSLEKTFTPIMKAAGLLKK